MAPDQARLPLPSLLLPIRTGQATPSFTSSPVTFIGLTRISMAALHHAQRKNCRAARLTQVTATLVQ